MAMFSRGALAAPPPQIRFSRLDPGDPRLEAVERLRFEVYCRECRFLDEDRFPDGRETDPHDPHSVHIAGRDGVGDVVATLRLVGDSPLGFPLESHLPEPLPELPRARTAEISRLIVRPSYRRRSTETLFGLFREMYEASLDQGIEYWLAAMEPWLWRWLGRFGFVFTPIGGPIEYFNEVVPYLADVNEMRKALRENRPDLLQFFHQER